MFIERLLTEPLFFFRIVLIVVLSITLHELAHGWAALSQGDDTPEISGHMTPNPIVHMGWPAVIFLCLAGIAWGAMPVNPSKFRFPRLGHIFVSAAGPFMNLSLAILFIVILKLYLILPLGKMLSIDFLALGASINLRLFLFNLLPIPPLDGFSICSEIFPGLKPLRNSPFGLVAFMIVWIVPGCLSGLFRVADFIFQTLISL
ncbi:MAG: site-2 protease family protein [Spirulina sp.]